MAKAKLAVNPEIKQVAKFGVVGIINTVLDFGILNVLRFGAGWALVPANVVSTTVAMAFSFFANKHVVFEHNGAMRRQLWTFLLTTAFGLYVLQNVTIELLTVWWTAPMHGALTALRDAGLHRFSNAFIITNCAKLVGTVISLIWNYLLYKKVVFI